MNFAVALSFYAAVLLSFAVLGVVAAYVGEWLSRWEAIFLGVSAAISLLAGLAMIFSPRTRKLLPEPRAKRLGLGGAFLFGILYSVAVVSTSTGPLLLLLAGAAAVGDPLFGGLLSVALRAWPRLSVCAAGDLRRRDCPLGRTLRPVRPSRRACHRDRISRSGNLSWLDGGPLRPMICRRVITAVQMA